MKIQYKGKGRVRVEGIGYFEQDEIREVPDGIGKMMCKKGRIFREAKKTEKKGRRRNSPPVSPLINNDPPMSPLSGGISAENNFDLTE